MKRLLALALLSATLATGTAYADDTVSGVTASIAPGNYAATQSVVLTVPDDRVIHYTVDGSDPIITSPIFSSPITVSEDTILRVAAFDENNVAGNTETLEYRILPVRSDRVSVGNFIKYACIAAGIDASDGSFIKTAIDRGFIEDTEFRDYSAAITVEDAAVVCNRVYEFLYGDDYSKTKFDNVISYDRISDLTTSSKQTDLVKCFIRGVMVGDSLGTFSTARRLNPTMPITVDAAKLAVKRLQNKDLCKVISADGQVTRNTDLPESYKEYKYVLESFPNSYYNKPQVYKYLNSVSADEVMEPYAMGSGTSVTGALETVSEFIDTSDVLGWCSAVEDALKLRFSVDYRTISEDWIQSLMNVSYQSVLSEEGFRAELENYVQNVRNDGTIIQCNKVVCDPSSLYYCQGIVYGRAYFSFSVLNSKSSSKSGFIECVLHGLYNKSVGNTISGYVDVPLVSDGTATGKYVLINAMNQIGNVLYYGDDITTNNRVALAAN